MVKNGTSFSLSNQSERLTGIDESSLNEAARRVKGIRFAIKSQPVSLTYAPGISVQTGAS